MDAFEHVVDAQQRRAWPIWKTRLGLDLFTYQRMEPYAALAGGSASTE
jgi:hypothetical protein